MNKYTFIKLREHGELAEQTAEWFHSKWNIPKAAYSESISECLKNKSAVPQWYVVLDGETIIAGLGVIENDFHNRKDLAPNVCAVYVEERYLVFTDRPYRILREVWLELFMYGTR